MSRRIGLTGSIGAGKSSAAKLLVARGAALIDADALAREATQDPLVLREIAEQLGEDLVRDGRLERERTAERVFADPQALAALSAIVHPWVRRASRERAAALEAAGAKVILLDIPLLYENGLERELDAVIVVSAPLAVRLARLRERSGLSAAEVEARERYQWSQERKAARADFVLDNSGDAAALEAQIARIWPQLCGEAEPG